MEGEEERGVWWRGEGEVSPDAIRIRKGYMMRKDD